MVTASRSGLGRRISQAFIAAAAGTFIGYQYALATVPPHVLEKSQLGGMYATGGAVVGVLSMRMGVLLVQLAREFFGRHPR
jgi:predicted membrane protein